MNPHNSALMGDRVTVTAAAGGWQLLAAGVFSIAMFASALPGPQSPQDSYDAAARIGDIGVSPAVAPCASCARVEQIRVLHMPRADTNGEWTASTLFGPAINAYTGNAGGYFSHFDRRYRVTLRMGDGSTRLAEVGRTPQFAVGDVVNLTDSGQVLSTGREM